MQWRTTKTDDNQTKRGHKRGVTSQDQLEKVAESIRKPSLVSSLTVKYLWADYTRLRGWLLDIQITHAAQFYCAPSELRQCHTVMTSCLLIPIDSIVIA